MTDDRKSGIALIAGSLGGILTMAIHPTGAASLTAEQVGHLSVISGAAHSLAMVSVLLLFLGACGLARRMAAADQISFAAIVTYGFACVAIMIAAAVSGFIVPGIMKHMVRDVPDAAHQWQIVIDGIFQIIKPSRAFIPWPPRSQSFFGPSPRCGTEESATVSRSTAAWLPQSSLLASASVTCGSTSMAWQLFGLARPSGSS